MGEGFYISNIIGGKISSIVNTIGNGVTVSGTINIDHRKLQDIPRECHID